MRVPLITIAVISRNAARTLREAIESALSQRYPALEVLVLDDASEDGTAELLASYATNPRVRAIAHATAQGRAAAYSSALREAKGEYVLFLAADNRLNGGAIERAMRRLRRHPELDAVYSGVFLLDDAGGNLGRRPGELDVAYRAARDEFATMLAYGCDLQFEAMLIRTAVVRAAGDFDGRFAQIDFEMLLRLTLADLRAAYDPEPFLFYRLHRNDETELSPDAFYAEYLRLLDAYVTPESAPRLYGYTNAIVARLESVREAARATGFAPSEEHDALHGRVVARLRGVGELGREHRATFAPQLALLVEDVRRPEDLAAFCARLSAQSPPPHEVVALVPAAYQADFAGFACDAPFELRILRFPTERSRAAMINTGMMLTRADVFAFARVEAHYRPEYFRDLAELTRTSDADVFVDTALVHLPPPQFERATFAAQAIPWITASMLVATRDALDAARGWHDGFAALGAWEWCVRAASSRSSRFVDLRYATAHPGDFHAECAAGRDAALTALTRVYASLPPADDTIASMRADFVAQAIGAPEIGGLVGEIYAAWERLAVDAFVERARVPVVAEELAAPAHRSDAALA